MIAQIGGENLYRQMLRLVRRKLREADCYRISLLSCRATKRPDSDRFIRCMLLDDLRKDFFF